MLYGKQRKKAYTRIHGLMVSALCLMLLYHICTVASFLALFFDRSLSLPLIH